MKRTRLISHFLLPRRTPMSIKLPVSLALCAALLATPLLLLHSLAG
jgi:hypothetical protein